MTVLPWLLLGCQYFTFVAGSVSRETTRIWSPSPRDPHTTRTGVQIEFKQFLRPEDRAVFEGLINQCKLYAAEAGVLASPVKEVPLLLSMIFAQHKRLIELEERVNES
jgi:hypothetical protein